MGAESHPLGQIVSTTDVEMRSQDSPDASSDDVFLGREAVMPKGVTIDEKDDDDAESLSSSLEFSKSTTQDVVHMRRIGRKQQLIRNYNAISMTAFVAVATASWEITIFAINQPLIDGGLPSLVWSFIWSMFLFFPIILSMCEMSSMAPISGSQYHWVSEFAPRKYQKILSYFTGWMSTLAWQAGNAQGVFLSGTLVQTIILINNDEYSFAKWQGTLLIIAMAVAVLLCNIYLNQYVAYAQHAFFFLHFGLFICLIVPIWVNAPKATATQVFTEFQNLGQWPNMGFAVLAGQLAGISGATGVDTAAHMAEEIKGSGTAVPRAMLGAYAVNLVFTLVSVVTLAFAMPDVQKALADPTYYPSIYILRHTMSKGCLTAFIVGVVAILFCGNIDYNAAVARDLFAFSRDNGFPFSKWLSKVHPKRHVPVNALITGAVISVVLSLTYIGNSVTFYALVSLCIVGLLQCYMFSIGSILWRRCTCPETLPPAEFSLGKYGIPINVAALSYSVWAFFWSFWPQTYHVTPQNFNWSPVIFGGVTVISLILYIVRKRHVYTGPVALVQGRRDE